MAKKYYLATVSWDLNQNIPAPIPSGFRWRSSRNMYFHLESPPTYSLIYKLALKAGVSKDGFRVDALSEVPNDFRKPWSDVDVFEDTNER
ncbi:MAG: hypothetical protein KDD10_17260 [Phaeodactylibacter sp.]|nr:hypothetical protein [Phaeodactylibacter sp.]MCB9294505.1 hypothetical protein [Lewinellaceae bacterium]MCO6491903.1 hypothetical protein [Phaeodactylibacter sp.]